MTTFVILMCSHAALFIGGAVVSYLYRKPIEARLAKISAVFE